MSDHRPFLSAHTGAVGRTTQADLHAQATDALRRAIESLGMSTGPATTGSQHDLVVSIDGIDVGVEIAAAAVITPGTVARMLAASERSARSVHLAVGDLVTSSAQGALRDAGWGWLDRRGRLVLRSEGVYIDTDVPADERSSAAPTRRPISGVAAVSWAAALLMSPTDPPAMRAVARRVSMSHSAIVSAGQRLKDAALVRSDGRPLIPELFWTLAESWSTRTVPLAHLPQAGDANADATLDMNLDRETQGWAVAGTVGAAVWGAPLAIGSAYPPDFYVPSATQIRRATRRLGEAPGFEDRACTVAVAPTPLICAERFDRDSNEWGHWRFAHGLFAALDLAQDRARGTEILADWNPKDFARVW